MPSMCITITYKAYVSLGLIVALAQIACIVVSQLLEYNTPLKTLGPWVPSSQVSECHKNFGYPSENGDPLLPLPHDFTTSVPYPNLSLSI